MTHAPLLTATASVLLVAGTVAVSRTRIRYWRKWGADLYDQFHDTMADRLDIDMTDLAP
jgi:limonene-1,2-epoxide hydrolase